MRDSLQVATQGPDIRAVVLWRGVTMLDVSMKRAAYSPHRHDRYAIGITSAGTLAFQFRGEQHYAGKGVGHILHPDELHDGRGLGPIQTSYRTLYISPSLIQNALGGKQLPFVKNPVIASSKMQRLMYRCLAFPIESRDDLHELDFNYEVMTLLESCAKERSTTSTPVAVHELSRIRELIREDPRIRWPMEEYERITGLDRWSIARQFRSLFGTSPSHYRVMRRLDLALKLIEAPMRISHAAQEAGFADQSHLARSFKAAYGFPLSVWVRHRTVLGACPN